MKTHQNTPTSFPATGHTVARGFTLIEILIAMAIVAILGAVAITQLSGRPDEARIVAAKTDIRTIMNSLQIYRLDNLTYPTAEQGLSALVTKPSVGPEPRNWKTGGYLSKMPVDPWGNPYQYLNPGLHGEIDVFSLGADKAPGGEGTDADIGNWDL